MSTVCNIIWSACGMPLEAQLAMCRRGKDLVRHRLLLALQSQRVVAPASSLCCRQSGPVEWSIRPAHPRLRNPAAGTSAPCG